MTAADVRGTKRAVASLLVPSVWAVVLGAASGSACVAVRLFFHLLQWVFVQQTGMFQRSLLVLEALVELLYLFGRVWWEKVLDGYSGGETRIDFA